ncbi:GntR family transcriptional regulator [Actinacidiphila sp. bgisy145]|uniref:GntR family transcriptional regulator n=1 Tax=Actinacidiphila sp. bgisy145 TaxID=3413792 RepID=UPI003EC09B8F
MPVYRQLSTALQGRIDAGEWGPGEKLPSEPELVREFGVNRLTVRQALDELERAGAVAIRHGKGTYVSEPATTVEVTIDPGSERWETAGGQWATREDPAPSVVEHVLSFGDSSDREAAGHLGVDPGELLLVRTLLEVHGLGPATAQAGQAVPCDYWLDRRRFGTLPQRWGDGPHLAVVLAREYGVTWVNDWRGFTAASAGLFVAEQLKVRVGTAVMVRDGVSVDPDGTPVFYVRRYALGSRSKYVMRYRPQEGRGGA